jgi:hypothetical protein
VTAQCSKQSFSPDILNSCLPCKEEDYLDGKYGRSKRAALHTEKVLLQHHKIKRVVIDGTPWLVRV